MEVELIDDGREKKKMNGKLKKKCDFAQRWLVNTNMLVFT